MFGSPSRRGDADEDVDLFVSQQQAAATVQEPRDEQQQPPSPPAAMNDDSSSDSDYDSSEEDEEEEEEGEQQQHSSPCYYLPNDILGLLLGHISSFPIFLNYLLLSRSFHDYATRLNPSVCSHILFTAYEMPKISITTTSSEEEEEEPPQPKQKPYVRRLRIMARSRKVRPSRRDRVRDFMHPANGVVFFGEGEMGLFPNLEELVVESCVVVVPRPMMSGENRNIVGDILGRVKKVRVRAVRSATMGMFVAEDDWERIRGGGGMSGGMITRGGDGECCDDGELDNEQEKEKGGGGAIHEVVVEDNSSGVEVDVSEVLTDGEFYRSARVQEDIMRRTSSSGSPQQQHQKQQQPLGLIVWYPCRTENEDDIYHLCQRLDERIRGTIWSCFASLESLKVEGAGFIARESIGHIPVGKLTRFGFRESQSRFVRTSRTALCFERIYKCADLLESVDLKLVKAPLDVPLSWFLMKNARTKEEEEEEGEKKSSSLSTSDACGRGVGVGVGVGYGGGRARGGGPYHSYHVPFVASDEISQDPLLTCQPNMSLKRLILEAPGWHVAFSHHHFGVGVVGVGGGALGRIGGEFSSVTSYMKSTFRLLPELRELSLDAKGSVVPVGPDALMRLRNLRVLRLRGIMMSFASVVVRLPELKVLELRHVNAASGRIRKKRRGRRGRRGSQSQEDPQSVSRTISDLARNVRSRRRCGIRELVLENFIVSAETLSQIGEHSLRVLQMTNVGILLENPVVIQLPLLTSLEITKSDSVTDKHLHSLSSLLRLRLDTCSELTKCCLSNKVILHHLRLAHCPKFVVHDLTDLPDFESMRELEIFDCPGISGILLRKTPFLRSLVLSESEVIGCDLWADSDLVSFSGLKNLEVLELNNSLVSDVLVRSIPSLHELRVNQSARLTGECLSSLRNLRVLDVYCSDAPDGGGFSRFAGLKRCRLLRELTVFAVHDTPRISRRVQRRLKVFKIR